MSGSSYTDYLHPLPTTLDAKNSPLALLAQTCYNISKDDSAKVLIPPIERKKDGRESVKSTSPLTEKLLHLGSKSPKEKSLSPPEKYTDSRAVKTSPKDRSPVRKSEPRSTVGSPREKKTSPAGKRTAEEGLKSKTNSVYGSLSVETNLKESHGASAHRSASSSPSAADGPPASGGNPLLPPSSKIPPGFYNHTGLLSPYYPALGLPVYPGYPLSTPGAAAGLLGAAVGAAEQKAESSSHQTVTHATVKTIAGATTLVPICSDPCCVQCRLSVQAAQFTPSCPTGCTECPREGHHNSAALPSISHLSGLHHPLSRLHQSLYSSNSTDLRNEQHSPPFLNQHVCNWVASGKYCGEQFSTSEELMTHLRSHTSSLDPPPSLSATALQSAAAYSSFAHPAVALSHLYGLSATPLSSLSSGSALRSGQPYGRSLSPSSSLLSSSRFHPYLRKSPLTSHIPPALPNTAGFPSASASLSSFPGLYSLPGSRLGPLVP